MKREKKGEKVHGIINHFKSKSKLYINQREENDGKSPEKHEKDGVSNRAADEERKKG